MLSRSVLATALLSLGVLCSLSDGAEHVPYRGPPAPLNHDGTVAFTADIKHANAAHNAAFAQEFKKLQAAESLAAAHPDRTSPPSPDYNPQYYQQQYDNGQYKQQQYDNGQYNSQQEDDGRYKPYLYDNGQTNQQYNSGSYNDGSSYNPQAHIPAPLNHDGSVAQTPEFNAIAASLHAAYSQALTRGRRSIYRYHGPPAPLNHDGTVANTEEVKHANAVHKAAYARQHHLLQQAQSHNNYQPQTYGRDTEEDDGQYKPHLYGNGEDITHHEDDGQYHHHGSSSDQYSHGGHHKSNPEAHIPAPLNHDGTVAHTSAYRAIAAVHHARYQKELHNVKRAF